MRRRIKAKMKKHRPDDLIRYEHLARTVTKAVP